MLPQTYTARIAALEDRIAFLQRLTIHAGLTAVGLGIAALMLVKRDTGFALGFADKVVLPLRLITDQVPTTVDYAHRALLSPGQGIVLGIMINLAVLGPLQDWVKTKADLDNWQARFARVCAAMIGGITLLTPWILIWAMTRFVYRRRVFSGSAGGVFTWITSFFGAMGGLLLVFPPLVLITTVVGEFDFSAQNQLKITTPAGAAMLPAEQGDAIGRDQYHYVRAQAAWIDHQPQAMVRELAAIEGAWHPRLRADRARLGFMAAEAAEQLSPAQQARLAAMGGNAAPRTFARRSRAALLSIAAAAALFAFALNRMLGQRRSALHRFATTIETSSNRRRQPGSLDGALA
ncbi:hypothetical protein [Novosphingobium sp. B 225]|uniref:hypothetical protein n=1 Tax=Novosphingobium sp. B 225 TaxID=1961849 RepID=UPI000B4B9E53|nr:hypothetical protein [Novosphingobium sp. B 225]